MRRIGIVFILLWSNFSFSQSTMRLDYFHSGDHRKELFSLDQLVIEPLSWAGNHNQPIDKLTRGKYLAEIYDIKSKQLIFSQSFSSIFGEWETTNEATQLSRSFHESVRFPQPSDSFLLVIKKRDKSNEFKSVWSIELDPNDYIHHRESANYQHQVIKIEHNGEPANKVDLLILGDGYTSKDQRKFESTARKLSQDFFTTYPFNKRRKDFNVWALAPNANQSGVSRPSSGHYVDSPLGTTYDAFRSERYLLTFDNKAWRRVASSVPYDAVIIITNSETYGGGGIYGLYSTAAAHGDWAHYLFVHEFGHHFAGLADEYFTSSVAYQTPRNIIEPYEPNVTALLNKKQLKWKHLVKQFTPLPTAWPKQAYEKHSLEYQKVRAQLRADKRPESEMDELFQSNQGYVEKLFSRHQNVNIVGAFEGANYQSKGYYRPSMNCIMFTRTKDFCAVCAEAIENMIDQFTKP